MKKLFLFFLLLPVFASAQQVNNLKTELRLRHDTTAIRCLHRPPKSNTVRIYRDDDDKVQTLIDALKRAGIVVERTEWNYQDGYSEYKIEKQ